MILKIISINLKKNIMTRHHLDPMLTFDVELFWEVWLTLWVHSSAALKIQYSLSNLGPKSGIFSRLALPRRLQQNKHQLEMCPVSELLRTESGPDQLAPTNCFHCFKVPAIFPLSSRHLELDTLDTALLRDELLQFGLITRVPQFRYRCTTIHWIAVSSSKM